MNEQRRQAAIEATKLALQREFGGFLAHDPYDPERFWTMTAEAVVDAAAPHLVGEPIEWIILNHYGAPAYAGTKDREEALDRARRWNEGRPADSRYRVVALVPVDEDLFEVPEVPLPPEYDGHTPEVAAGRPHGVLGAPVASTPQPVGEPVVLAFIEQRVEYVRVLRQFRGSSRDADYWRWQGHAEARRQLAEKLGVKVPYEPRDRRAVVDPVEDAG